MIRKAVVLLMILAAGICAYRGSSPYIDARMEQEHLKQAAFPGNAGNRSDGEEHNGNGTIIEEMGPYASPIDFETQILLAGYRFLEPQLIILFAGGLATTNII